MKFKSGDKMAYRKYCPECNKDCGYRLKTVRNTELLCRSCSRFKASELTEEERSEYKNVDFDDYRVIKGSKKYLARCVLCDKIRGYFSRKRLKNKCKSCSLLGKKLSLESKIKISLTNSNRDVFTGFKTSFKEQQRILFLKKGLHTQCFERYSYTCAKCGKVGGTLNAHHMNSWHTHEDQRFDIDNLICLCKICHRLFHKIYSQKNNTREQMDLFLL